MYVGIHHHPHVVVFVVLVTGRSWRAAVTPWLPLSNGAQICEIGSREDPVLRPMAVTHIVRGGSGATNGEIKHSPASPAGPLQCIPYLNIHLQMIYDKIQPIYLH